MRIVRCKLNPDVVKLLQRLSKDYGFEDPDFAVDVFALFRLRGSGLPNDTLMERLAELTAKKLNIQPLTARAFIRRKTLALSTLKATTVFRLRLLSMYDKPVDAVKDILMQFAKINSYVQTSRCMTCHLMSTCDFGKMLGKQSVNVQDIMNPELLKKVHPDCPDKPTFDLEAFTESASVLGSMMQNQTDMQLQQATTGMRQKDMDALMDAAKQAEADALADQLNISNDPDSMMEGMPFAGNGNTFDASMSPRELSRINDRFVQSLSKESLEMWRIARKISESIDKEGLSFKPTSTAADKKKVKRIDSLSDVAKIQPHQHAMPDDMFNKAVADKSLMKRQNLTPNAQKQLLFVLHDVSGSMKGLLAWNANIHFTSAAIAKAIILAFFQRLEADNGIACYAPFTGNIGRIRKASEKLSFSEIRRYVSGVASNGNSTDIHIALMEAMKFIGAQADELGRCEIMLLTDGISRVNEEELKAMRDKHGIKIHTVFIRNGYAPKTATIYPGYKVLQNLSESVIDIVNGEVGVTELINSMKTSRKGAAK